MQVAILGLSDAGKIMLSKLLDAGHEVVVWNNSKEELEQIRTEKAEFIVNQKLTIVHSIDEAQNILRKPRVLCSMQEAGEPTETMLLQLNQFTEAGDVVIDGSNSNYKDTERRFEEFDKRDVKFLGIGLTGGVSAGENGFCLMIGGDPDAYQYLSPIFETLAMPNGAHSYFGSGGAGHFVNMVHSAVEEGMLQVVAEGMGILRKSDYQLDSAYVANTWQDGAIVSSFIVDMAIDALIKDPNLSEFDGRIIAPKLAKLAREQAKETSVLIPAITQSLDFSEKSQYDNAIAQTFTAKLIQAMKREIDGI
ncbi:MAG TPA: NAD(P)-binding domain-containing protein [Candidatus Saccharimonadales bacterium]|nr:NAD(P)-binding domain-containing protein [Candidatus Saccharimonadales bacterium]